MKILRVCLLLLVAVLTPVRGVLAAAMICPHASAGAGAQVAHQAAALHAEGSSERVFPHAHVHAHAAPAQDPGQLAHAHSHDHAASHACTLCASCCFTVPLSPTFSPTVASLEPAAAPLPSVRALAPSFFSDGPERPPRGA